MHILVTNDDGIQSPGLRALAKGVCPFGNVTVIAPEHNWSVCGHAKTLTRPLRVKPVQLDGDIPAWSTDGVPSDCVALGMLGFLKEPVNLVVSGINAAPNLGIDISYSGTVANAIEATIWKVPGIAFSLDVTTQAQDEVNYDAAGEIARRVVARVVQQGGLPPEILLNVNIPLLPLEQIKGYRISRMGERVYRDVLISRVDPFGKPYYWIGGEIPAGEPEEGTDIGDLKAGYVSITPLHLDLTAYQMIPQIRGWEW